MIFHDVRQDDITTEAKLFLIPTHLQKCDEHQRVLILKAFAILTMFEPENILWQFQL